MATTEQFSLRWNNFHSNLTTGFHDLLQAADMVDVTLAVEGQFLQAHKIVLSICSPFFKQMFRINPCKHPVVILKDVSRDNMKDILEFMYLGEVNVLRDNLPSFLRTAELLQVKGLTGDDSQSDTSSRNEDKLESLGDVDDDSKYNQLPETDVSSQCDLQYQLNKVQATNQKRPARNSLTNTSNLKKSRSEPLNHTKNNQTIKAKTENCKSEEEIALETTASIKLESPYDFEEPVKDALKVYDMNNAGLEVGSHDHGKTEERGGPPVGRHPYKCDKCTKMFSRRDHLRTHEKNIHGEDVGPFACIICAQLYKNAESLRKHIAKFHFQRTADPPQNGGKVQVTS